MLTDSKIKGLKAGPTPYKRYDAEGLFILVSPTGGKLWRFRYRFGAKAKLLSFAAIPTSP